MEMVVCSCRDERRLEKYDWVSAAVACRRRAAAASAVTSPILSRKTQSIVIRLDLFLNRYYTPILDKLQFKHPN